MTILTGTPAWAEKPVSSSNNSATSEPNTPFDQELDHPARTLKQASLLAEPSAELLIESSNFASLEPSLLLNTIAQADAPTLQPSDPQPSDPQPSAQPPESPPSDPKPSQPLPEPASSDSAYGTASDRWQISVSPYFFVPLRVRTDATLAGSTSFKLGLGDILDFDRAFNASLRVEAWKNQWGVILDGFYISAKDSGKLGVTFPFRTLEDLGINAAIRASANASLSVRQGTVDLAASYHAVDTTLSGSASSNPFPRLVVAPTLGVRTNILSQKLEIEDIRIDLIPFIGKTIPINRDFSFSKVFPEPMIGAQIRLDLSRHWAMGIRGDVSSFNINVDRNLTWNFLADVRHHFSPRVSLQLGYRINDFEFEDGFWPETGQSQFASEWAIARCYISILRIIGTAG
ncbi:hypothetical protein [Leptodesmis sp.]|uniref:hypothetical protein n=1 Tax=Leptodesmis sp. TaxID=3100501 RepID=UPI0040534E44